VVRVTLVHQGALGDTLLLMPLVRSIKARFAAEGGVHVTLVTRPNLGQALTMHGHIDAFASADDRAHSAWFAPPEGDKPNSRPDWATCDVLLSAVSNGDDAWAANARLAVNPGTMICYFEPRPPADYPGHVTTFHRVMLGSLSLPGAPPVPVCSNPDGPILVHPGSGGEAKCWPRENFIQLARDLKRNGIILTIILGEAEQERWGRALMKELGDEFPFYLHIGLYELIEKMSRARIYLGNDSGVSHLAAMTGVPTITLFGPSDDRQWRPVGPHVEVLRAPPPHERDLTRLSVPDVMAAIMAELRRI